MRRLVDYALGLEIEREQHFNMNGYYFKGRWERVAKDFHVRFLKQNASSFINGASRFGESIERAISKHEYGALFDLIEFFTHHSSCSAELKNDLASAFTSSRSAYRLIDNKIVAVGTEEQAQAVEAALQATQETNELSARSHLLAAGRELRNGDWANSIRESIHAAEAVAVKLAPKEKTLGAALKVLEQKGYLHKGLKNAFGNLYGYTNDEKGVRHALVFGEEANVDETDALFMLGACASFVSYLIARSSSK